MITEFTTRVQTPDEGFDWLYKDQAGEPRMFRHEVGLPPQAEPWLQCTNSYKEGYDLLWSLRQEPHTDEERQALEAQYAAWCSANPALVDEIDRSVPVKPEPTPEPKQEGGEV